MALQQKRQSATARDETIPRQVAALEQELDRLKHAILGVAAPRDSIALPLEALIVEAGGFHLAIDVHDVVAAISMVWVEPLAGAPQAIRGSINFRGLLVPVLDLAVGMGHPPAVLHPDLFLVVVQAGPRALALLVHGIKGVQLLTEAERAAAATTSTTLPSFVRSLFRWETSSLMLVDPSRLLASGELDVLGELLSDVPAETVVRP